MSNYTETEGDELKPVLVLSINKKGKIIKTSVKKNEETGNWEKDKTFLVDNIFGCLNTKEKRDAFKCFTEMINENIKEVNELLKFI